MNQIELLKQQFEELISKLNEKFEEKLSTLNKRYHVIEQSLKQKIKLLEAGKNKKNEDLEIVKLKAKIISLEKQISLLESNDNKFHRNEIKISDSKSNSDIFKNILECLANSQGKAEFAKIYYPQIDTLIPCLIEILPISIGLLSEFSLNLYYNKFRQNDRLIQLQTIREKQKSIESHLNEIMLSQGKTKKFEIAFNPQTETWKKIEAEKDYEKRQEEGMSIILLTQIDGVQIQIIKMAKQKLEQSYHKIKREKNILQQQNFQQQFCQKSTIIERIDCIVLILILSSNKEEMLFAMDQIIEDFSIENGQLKLFFFQILNEKDFDYLITKRMENFKSSLEIQYSALMLMNLIVQNQQSWQQFLYFINKNMQECKNLELVQEFKKSVQTLETNNCD